MTSLALGEWRSTGDPAWLAAIGAIDARLVQCEDLAVRMGGSDGIGSWRSLKRYWAWRGRRLSWHARDESALRVIRAVAADREARIDAKQPAEEKRATAQRLSRAQRRERNQARAIAAFRRGAARMAQSLAEQGKGP